jgi:hypothetical protein
VQIVPAGVHHADILAGRVLGAHRAGEGRAGLLFHRERVEFGAHQDRGSAAILHHRHDAESRRTIAELSQMLGDRIAGLAQLSGH